MSDWHPYTEPPQKVCDCEINDVFGHTIKTRYDGRHFRYAEGPYIGTVVAHYKGDLWRSIEGEQ